MLRVLEIVVIIAIVVYGFIKLFEMFAGWRFRVNFKKACALDDLAVQAKKVAKEKEDILKETEKTKEQIDNINNTLN
jgi:hypothetical protein